MDESRESWRDLFERSVRGYHEGDLEGGRRACEQLLAVPDLPADVADLTQQNLTYYAPRLASIAPGAQYLSLEPTVALGWSRYNPSIATVPNGYRVLVRSSDFWLEFGRSWVLDSAATARNDYIQVDLDENLRVVRSAAIVDETNPAGTFSCTVTGYEDCRLFEHAGNWYAVATARDRNPECLYQSVLLQLDDGAFRDAHLLSDFRTGIREKNWMPVPLEGDPAFIRWSSPTVLVRFDVTTGKLREEVSHPAPPIAAGFHGGSQAVRFDDGFLCLVHEVAVFDEGRRVYRHRWMRLDDRCRITHISRQFWFVYRQGIEFAAGLAWHGHRLVASFGVNDREAYLVTVPADEVRALLEPVGSGERRPLPGRPFVGAAVAATRPFIVSTTVAGNAQEQIGDALRSVVDAVDACLVIDTGVADETLEAALSAAGDKLVVRPFGGADDAAARNYALDAAAELGAAWALSVDPQERLLRNGTDLREVLAASDATVLRVARLDGTIAPNRCFRLPRTGHWKGGIRATYVDPEGSTDLLPGVRFDVAPIDPAGRERQVQRDLPILERCAAAEPAEPHWWYALGDAFQTLARHEEAIDAYRRCWELDGWDEQAAWAMYRSAQCWLSLGNPVKAAEASATGMTRHAGLAELPWQAAFASYQAGNDRQAVRWAELSAALGLYRGTGDRVERRFYRRPEALYEGPFDVLRFALARLGDGAGADAARRDYEAAMRARLAAGDGM